MQANYPPSLNIRLSTWENTLQTWGIYSTNAHFILIKCIEWWTYRRSILNFDKKSMLIFSLQHLFFNKSMIIIKIKHVLMNSCNITVSYKQHKRLSLCTWIDQLIILQSFVKLTLCSTISIYVLKVKIKNRERKSIFHIWLSLIQNNTSLFIEEKVRVNALIFVFNSSNYLNVSVLDSNLVCKFLTFKALCNITS